ncbi:Procollagen galactosyltransferase 1 [Sphaceloma murrayae]|uniref:Procollagen galactosyltransferase 1 n=1 Tax=Sphaceloma murrayae TaxID=2082308 RepID=A0A2K1QSA9_9PEZI|nr:Procollagen galactosyltransferase 1 [Sphaceloma murrayae]
MPIVRKITVLLSSIAFIFFFFFHNDGLQVAPHPMQLWRKSVVDEAQLRKPADSHLGFDAVVAVSPEGSWRQKKLLQQAAITEIDITIPKLPKWTDDDIGNFTERLAYGGRESAIGSMMAWLSHHRVLEWFLESKHETILIMEDDMDWDIRMRTVQIPRAAAAVRSLLQPATSYWGNTKAWDVLYLGHCGDWLQKLEKGFDSIEPSNLTSRPHIVYKDPTMPRREELHPFSRKFLDSLQLPERTRAIHASGHALCTFAYAVNRRSAKKILEEIAPISRPESFAFDAAMLLGCQHRGLQCYTVNPEIFHHQKGLSIIKQVEHMNQEWLPPVDKEGLQQTMERGETSNIDCGFLSGEFAFQDPKIMEYLREEVGRKGRCLKQGRDGQPFDMGWEGSGFTRR